MKVIFENHTCCIFDAAGHKILQARMRGKSFSFLPFEGEHTAFPVNLSDTELWHKRLGHCHQKRMLTMKVHEAVRGMQILKMEALRKSKSEIVRVRRLEVDELYFLNQIANSLLDLHENGDALEGVCSFTKMYKFNKLISALHQEYATEDLNSLFNFLLKNLDDDARSKI
ncbi:hypothetical protein DKX38_022048 [Salix brachista]|uniref:GAG-pre-integrase domain-containing protein n=1 Tax=Salix brachista TaxID=2182728 RepID=A0A5N5JYQ6_9ROSI|nr:hypothetical protein DKX38_022048 [Salix brachista]